MFALFALLPSVSNTACKINFTTPHLVSVMPLYFAYVSYIVHFSSVMFLSGTCAQTTPFFLATPSLLATPLATSNGEKIKTENQGKVFSQTCFSFIWLLIKKPRKGKKSVPFNKTVTQLLYISQLK